MPGYYPYVFHSLLFFIRMICDLNIFVSVDRVQKQSSPVNSSHIFQKSTYEVAVYIFFCTRYKCILLCGYLVLFTDIFTRQISQMTFKRMNQWCAEQYSLNFLWAQVKLLRARAKRKRQLLYTYKPRTDEWLGMLFERTNVRSAALPSS